MINVIFQASQLVANWQTKTYDILINLSIFIYILTRVMQKLVSRDH